MNSFWQTKLLVSALAVIAPVWAKTFGDDVSTIPNWRQLADHLFNLCIILNIFTTETNGLPKVHVGSLRFILVAIWALLDIFQKILNSALKLLLLLYKGRWRLVENFLGYAITPMQIHHFAVILQLLW